MKILVLGAGRQGKIVAQDLVKCGYDVIVSDIANFNIDGAAFITADLSNAYRRAEVVKKADLVVCALPARLGYGTIKSCIVAGVDCVDMSYCSENVLDLDSDAKYKKVKILPDCGIAPGLSNLVAGRAIKAKSPYKLSIQVGGFAKDPDVPLGYSLTWSPEDLLEEFVRPARIVENYKIVEKKALSGIEEFGSKYGKLESFYTDGLRTLLNCKSVPYMEEKTIRRAGHIEKSKELVEKGEFLQFVEENCSGLEDVLYMKISADDESYVLCVESEDGLTAMVRSTAFSCSAFVQAMAEGFVEGYGVITPEKLAKSDDCYTYILDLMATKNIMFGDSGKVEYPFYK